MAVEIEKKYRIIAEKVDSIRALLVEHGVLSRKREFESNVLYSNGQLKEEKAFVRIRNTDTYSAITYKKHLESREGAKLRIEHESRIDDPDAIREIVLALSLVPVIRYEKYRTTWKVLNTEVVFDELPFGKFVEIEGDIEAIDEVAEILRIGADSLVNESYPTIVFQNCEQIEGVHSAVFVEKD